MKQKISKDLIWRRYSEFREMGMTKEQATMRIGQGLLLFYGIDWTEGRGISFLQLKREQKGGF